MTDDGVYARAYARALYGAATARHEEPNVTDDVLALELQWKGSPELRRFCRSHQPGSPRDRARSVEQLWGKTFTPTMMFFFGDAGAAGPDGTGASDHPTVSEAG